MYRDGGIFDLSVEEYIQIRQDASLEPHLQQRVLDLDRDMQIAVHRNANEKHEITKQINSVAVKVGQLCSIDAEYSHVDVPFTKLFTTPLSEDVFKCDLLGKYFEKIKPPGFSFRGQFSVQVGSDLYATSYEKCTVTQIKNLLDMGKDVEINILGSHDKERIGHSACAFKNQALYIIAGATKTFSVHNCQKSVYCF